VVARCTAALRSQTSYACRESREVPLVRAAYNNLGVGGTPGDIGVARCGVAPSIPYLSRGQDSKEVVVVVVAQRTDNSQEAAGTAAHS